MTSKPVNVNVHVNVHLNVPGLLRSVHGHVHGFTEYRLLITDYLLFFDMIYRIDRIRFVLKSPKILMVLFKKF